MAENTINNASVESEETVLEMKNTSGYITRTYNSTIITATVAEIDENLNLVKGSREWVLDGKLDIVEAQAKLRKANPTMKIKVENVKNIDEVRGMRVEDFYKHSVKINRIPCEHKDK